MEKLNIKTQQELQDMYAKNISTDNPFVHPLLMGGVLYGGLSVLVMLTINAIISKTPGLYYTLLCVLVFTIGFALFCLIKYIVTFKSIKQKYREAIQLTDAIDKEIAARHAFYLSHQTIN